MLRSFSNKNVYCQHFCENSLFCYWHFSLSLPQVCKMRLKTTPEVLFNFGDKLLLDFYSFNILTCAGEFGWNLDVSISSKDGYCWLPLTSFELSHGTTTNPATSIINFTLIKLPTALTWQNQMRSQQYLKLATTLWHIVCFIDSFLE